MFVLRDSEIRGKFVVLAGEEEEVQVAGAKMEEPVCDGFGGGPIEFQKSFFHVQFSYIFRVVRLSGYYIVREGDFNVLDGEMSEKRFQCPFFYGKEVWIFCFGALYCLQRCGTIPEIRPMEKRKIRSYNREVGMRKLTLGEEQVAVRGIRPEEQLWGAYQFPRPYNLGERLVVSVDVCEDNIQSFGKPKRWFESRDGGRTWNEVDASVSIQCGLRLANGDLLYFPMVSGTILKGYQFTPQNLLTPGYDFSRRAEEGVFPIPDGICCWIDGTVIRAYNADRLPESLSRKEWIAQRVVAGKTEVTEERVAIEWPYLTRVVHEHQGVQTLKSLFPRGNPRIGPDGAIWVTAFSGEGHLNPENGLYSPYYSAELFRSTDLGHSFQLLSHMEYEADGKVYPYKSGGFSDSDIEFMPDGSIVWFLRTAWYCSTGEEVAPMYMARSTDGGKTWSKPRKFAETGILPRLCKLGCGVTLLCYARPGIFVQATENDSGTLWSDPLVVMTPADRSSLANHPVVPPTFHDWDGCCCNPEMVPLDRNSALIFYSDFYFYIYS